MKKNLTLLLSLLTLSTLSLNSCIFVGGAATLYDIFHTSSHNDNTERITGNVTYNTPSYNSSFTKENLNKDNIGLGLGQKYLPSVGNSKLLVIPVQFSDGSSFTSSQTQIIKNTFFGDASDTGWESLSSFYKTSSYGKLNITGEVTSPVTAKYSLSQIDSEYKKNNNLSYTKISDEILYDAVSQVSSSINLSDYDVNSDGYIDGVWLVYNEPTYQYRKNNNNLFWAYTYWYNSDNTVNNKKINVYAWGSYDFLVKDTYTQSKLDKTKAGDAHTVIHETGHMLGLDDYYSSDSSESPTAAVDMMDNNIIDHMAYSKFALGWITPTVITEELLSKNNNTLSINSLVETGESYLLPIYKDNSIKYNGTPFDEYLILETYTPTSLNYQDSHTRYESIAAPSEVGLRVYHVNARIGKIVVENNSLVWDSEHCSYDKIPVNDNDYYAYYYLYSNSNGYSYGTLIDDSDYSFYRTRLVSLLPQTGYKPSYYNYMKNTSLYQSGSSFMLSGGTYSQFVFDDGSKPQYGFKVTGTTSSSVTVTFTAL